MDDQQRDFDVIVVGTGPGGATVAKELCRRGQRVLILERGPGRPDTGGLWQGLTQMLVPGKSLLLTGELLQMARGIAIGGSSTFYYATAFPVPLAMFRRHGIDLGRDVEAARVELPIAPLRDEMMSPMASRLMEAARTTGLDWHKLDKLMHQERWRPGLPFGYYGDPTGVKWTARAFVDEAVRTGATLLTSARVRRVMVEKGRATGVEYLARGRLTVAAAPKVVIAAGGIGSPIILRNSGIREAGFDFFFDPLITVCGTVPDVRTRTDEIPMSAGIHLEDEGIMLTDMHVSRALHVVFSLQVPKPSRLLAFGHTARIMVKIKDALGGRVTDREGIRKRLAAADRAKLRRGLEVAERILKAAGARDIYKCRCLAAHPGGTVKLGQLLDANLQTSIANLHVCDCSVVPEAWGLPPTLTLIALGKYLARALAS